jgi:preprotein translocase subunit SecA
MGDRLPHASANVLNRSLAGRCARQGDPGSVQIMLSTQQPLIARSVLNRIVTVLGAKDDSTPQWLLALVVRLPQYFEESRRRSQRKELLRRDMLAEKLTPAMPRQ